MRNLQEQVKKAFCYQKLFWPFTVWINCSIDLKNFVNSQPSASNFMSFSWSLEHFFLTVGQNNFGNKIPLSPQRSGLKSLGDNRDCCQRAWIHPCIFKGRLGLGHEEDVCTPQEIKALNTEEVYIVNVCCSSAGTILLSDVGTLYACGENNENRY